MEETSCAEETKRGFHELLTLAGVKMQHYPVGHSTSKDGVIHFDYVCILESAECDERIEVRYFVGEGVIANAFGLKSGAARFKSVADRHRLLESGHQYKPPMPDVVASLVIDAECLGYTSDVADFCAEFGYCSSDGEPLLKGLEVYEACKKANRDVMALLGAFADEVFALHPEEREA